MLGYPDSIVEDTECIVDIGDGVPKEPSSLLVVSTWEDAAMLSPLLRLLMVAIAGSHCTAVTVANAEISEIGAPAGSPSVGRWLDEDDFDDSRSSPDDRSWWDDDESISEDADEDELSHSATAGSASIAEQPALDRVGR
ncbi:hypothetical protein THAOC_19847, partial [Thalassiosira oceanica]